MASSIPARLHDLLRVSALEIVLTISGVAAVLMCKGLLKTKGQFPLPPGPPGLPVVGNIFDVPGEDFWWKYKEWSDTYGSDVIYLNVLGKEIVILNSLAACTELLEKRSTNYSSRPKMAMMNDLIGFGWNIGFIPYSDTWKERRKALTRAFSPQKVAQQRPALVKACRKLLTHLLDDPQNFREHIRLFSGSFILDITYGLDVISKNDVYITQAEAGMRGMAAAGTASSFLVDFIPSIQYLPSWLPGMGFKREAAVLRVHALAMAREPLKFAEKALKEGNARPCIATELLEELEDEGGETYLKRRSVIQDALGSVYSGGSDTTVSSITTFFLAMVQNPDIQIRAQAIVDEALADQGRLPDFTEYKKLAYIEALVREVLRWRPVGPVGVPRTVAKDDVYGSYRIPRGATVVANIYAIAHDPLIYGPNTHLFDPSRFLNPGQTEISEDAPTAHEVFGFGRRACPGLQSAVESIWIVIVSVLSAFHISRDEREAEGEDFGRYTSAMLIHPYPFKVRIEPRSKEAEALIRHVGWP